MNVSRALAWRFHWYRFSELDGALLLGKLVRATSDSYLIRALTKHCADEARHSLLWLEAIEASQLPPVRILRSYQSLYYENGAPPRTMAEVLAVTHIFELRVDSEFQLELENPYCPAPVRKALQVMLNDEKGHLSWIHQWLGKHAEGEDLLKYYRQRDEMVYIEVAKFKDCLWEYPGIGEELQFKARE